MEGKLLESYYSIICSLFPLFFEFLVITVPYIRNSSGKGKGNVGKGFWERIWEKRP